MDLGKAAPGSRVQRETQWPALLLLLCLQQAGSSHLPSLNQHLPLRLCHTQLILRKTKEKKPNSIVLHSGGDNKRPSACTVLRLLS